MKKRFCLYGLKYHEKLSFFIHSLQNELNSFSEKDFRLFVNENVNEGKKSCKLFY